MTISNLVQEMYQKYNVPPKESLAVYNDCEKYFIYYRNDYALKDSEVDKMAIRFLEPPRLYIDGKEII